MKPPNSFSSDDIDEILQQVYEYINMYNRDRDIFDGSAKITIQKDKSQTGISARRNDELFYINFKRDHNPYLQIATIISEVQSDTELLYKISLSHRG